MKTRNVKILNNYVKSLMFPEKWNIRCTKGSLEVDSTWKKKQRAAKEDMTEVGWEIDIRSRIDLGHCAADAADKQKWRFSG